MSYFLGTVSSQSPKNWELAKGIGLWGVTASRLTTSRGVEEGDHLIIWMGGHGYIAECLITGPGRSPRNMTEAPWEGGTYQWVAVVPFAVMQEVRQPVWLGFRGDKQEQTLLSKAKFRSSFQRLAEKQARDISAMLRRRATEERKAAAT